MYASITPEGSGYIVETYYSETHDVIERKWFPSFNGACAALIHSGWYCDTDVWYPAPCTENYVATLAYSENGKIKSKNTQLLHIDSQLTLWLTITQAHRGYGFSFLMPPISEDPIIRILTSGLFDVSCIGCWPSEKEAQKAGEEFFRRVQRLVGSDTLITMLKIVREQACLKMEIMHPSRKP